MIEEKMCGKYTAQQLQKNGGGLQALRQTRGIKRGGEYPEERRCPATTKPSTYRKEKVNKGMKLEAGSHQRLPAKKKPSRKQ